jgi:hypothetical protein
LAHLIEVILQRFVLRTLLRKLSFGFGTPFLKGLLLLLHRLLTVSLLHLEQEADANEHQGNYQ